MKIQKFNEASISDSIENIHSIDEISARINDIYEKINDDIKEFLIAFDDFDQLYHSTIVTDFEKTGLKREAFEESGEMIGNIIQILEDTVRKYNRF